LSVGVMGSSLSVESAFDIAKLSRRIYRCQEKEGVHFMRPDGDRTGIS
jgi:hypothetical protein